MGERGGQISALGMVVQPVPELPEQVRQSVSEAGAVAGLGDLKETTHDPECIDDLLIDGCDRSRGLPQIVSGDRVVGGAIKQVVVDASGQMGGRGTDQRQTHTIAIDLNRRC